MVRHVISICGQPGSGKSTTVEALAKRLEGAIALPIDGYEGRIRGGASFFAWVQGSIDFNDLSYPRYAVDLRTLREGGVVLAGENGSPLRAGRYIITDDPRGRCSEETRGLIDLAVFLDTPREVALARFLLRDETLAREDLVSALRFYLDCNRRFCLAHDELSRPGCDLVVDGMKPVDEIVDSICEEIRGRFAPSCRAAPE